MSHKGFDNIVVGKVELYIIEVAEEIPAFFDDLSVVMTRHDGGGRVRVREDSLTSPIEERGDACIFSPSAVKQLIQLEWPFEPFEPFEEIFLCHYSDIPQVINQLDDSFTAELDLSGNLLSVFAERFKYLGAKRFLSDGLGLLNYACELEFANQIESIANR